MCWLLPNLTQALQSARGRFPLAGAWATKGRNSINCFMCYRCVPFDICIYTYIICGCPCVCACSVIKSKVQFCNATLCSLDRCGYVWIHRWKSYIVGIDKTTRIMFMAISHFWAERKYTWKPRLWCAVCCAFPSHTLRGHTRQVISHKGS